MYTQCKGRVGEKDGVCVSRGESSVSKLGFDAHVGHLCGHVQQEPQLGSGALEGLWEGGDGWGAVSTKMKPHVWVLCVGIGRWLSLGEMRSRFGIVF